MISVFIQDNLKMRVGVIIIFGIKNNDLGEECQVLSTNI